MGTSSLTKLGRLFWLGRYLARAGMEIEIMQDVYDKAIDGPAFDYVGFCNRLEIPSAPYAGSDDFISRFLFDAEDPFSVRSNVNRAYDNAIVLRETISSTALSYIQMAVNIMESAASGVAPMLDLQSVTDMVYAFRGRVDDTLVDSVNRYTFKCGSSVERIDMNIRLGLDLDSLGPDLEMLGYRMRRTPLRRDAKRLVLLLDLAANPEPQKNRVLLLDCVEGLFPDM